MRAPVYRHVDGQSTVAGVSLHGFIALLAVALGAIQLLSFAGSLVAIAGTYAAMRLAGRGKPSQFWQHLIVFHARRLIAAGRLSAAVRTRIPRFPHGPYFFRDAGR